MAFGKINVGGKKQTTSPLLTGTMTYTKAWRYSPRTSFSNDESVCISVDDKGRSIFMQNKAENLVVLNPDTGVLLSSIAHHKQAYYVESNGYGYSDGGYYLPRNNDGDSVYLSGKTTDLSQGFVMKYSKTGDLIWQYTKNSLSNNPIGRSSSTNLSTSSNNQFVIYDKKENAVYALIDNNELVKLDANGNLLWSYINSAVTFAGIAFDGECIYIKADTKAIKLNAANGVFLLEFTNSNSLIEVAEAKYDAVFFANVSASQIKEYDKNFIFKRDLANYPATSTQAYASARTLLAINGQLLFWSYTPNSNVFKTYERATSSGSDSRALPVFVDNAIGNKIAIDKKGSIYTVSRNAVTKISPII